jgi:DNA-binding IclR family transcriptional regulator
MIIDIFTKKNIDILMFLSKNTVHIRDIADMMHISPAKAHGAVQLFKRYHLVTETKKKNLKIIQLNHDSLLLKRIKNIINMEEEIK